MPEEKPEKTKTEVMPWLSKPIDGSGKIPDHIAEDTLMVKGIDPDTKQRFSIHLPALLKEHGEKKGRDLYIKIAKAGGFLDPNIESRGGNAFWPDLDLESIGDAKAKADVEKILKEA